VLILLTLAVARVVEAAMVVAAEECTLAVEAEVESISVAEAPQFISAVGATLASIWAGMSAVFVPLRSANRTYQPIRISVCNRLSEPGMWEFKRLQAALVSREMACRIEAEQICKRMYRQETWERRLPSRIETILAMA
jgi:hypothetical protein